jgi:hypothetical protein
MTKAIQILLLAAFLFPMFGSAQEETLEERKKRVTRKYLRERMNVSQSEMVVPEDLTEDVRVLDSEKFKEATVDLQRQAATTPPPPPMPRRPMPEQADSNWLLNDIDNKEVDLYADPFAPSKPSDDRPDYRSMIRDRKSDDQATGSSRSSIYDPYASRNRYDTSTRYGAQATDGKTGIFGQRQSESDAVGGLGTRRTFGASPETGLLQTPFPQIETSEDQSLRPGSREPQGIYSPYKSPYQIRREEQRQQGGALSPGSTRQEFNKPDPYQQWKNRSNTWDPTKDDAYLDEIMRQDRR